MTNPIRNSSDYVRLGVQLHKKDNKRFNKTTCSEFPLSFLIRISPTYITIPTLSKSPIQPRATPQKLDMGFPCMCNSFSVPKPLAQFVQIVCHIRLIMAIILSHLGLRSPPVEFSVDPFPEEHHGSLFDASNRSPAPENPSSTIKSELPVVEFAGLFRRSQGLVNKSEEPTCVVCLGWLEAKDEVRELGNCDHAFHKECIDRWVDVGHVTCPLCRLQLLPRQTKEASWIRRVRLW